MSTTTAIQPISRTIQVPGGTLTYDLRPNEASNELPLFLAASPAGAGGFPSLASHFTDRTVITFDPRNNGEGRSTADDPSVPLTAEVQAEDVHAVIEAVGGGPVDMFASSGGAIVSLALVAHYPNDIRTLVAHEPPFASLVPDREQALAANKAIYDAYLANGAGAGMGKFMQIVMHGGPFTPEVVAAPPLDPAMFGMPSEDDGVRTDLMLAHNVRYLTSFEPDFEALKRAPTRIVIAVGEKSNGNLAQRGGEAAAERLGSEAVKFPGDHGGFMGGEYGQPPGEPEAFAAKLREVLAGG